MSWYYAIMTWLQRKYISLIAPFLDGFVRKSDKLWNMRCMYCGDSKNKSKKRGYLYEKKGMIHYKCHNCGVGRSFDTFLRDQGSAHGIYRAYVLEKLGKDTEIEPVKSDAEVLKEIRSTTSPTARSVERLFDSMMDKVSDLPDDHPAKVYALSRHIPEDRLSRLYWVENIKDMGQLSEKAREKLEPLPGSERRIVIPAFDQFGKLIGVTSRDITGDSKLRYIATKISDDEEPMIFGENLIDRSKTVFVVEGPLDSLFIDNCVAVGGSDFMKIVDRFPKAGTVYIFDNQPMNPDVVKNYNTFVSSGNRIFIWPESIHWTECKDINDLAMKRPNMRFPENMTAFIEENTWEGLTAQMRLAKWVKRG